MAEVEGFLGDLQVPKQNKTAVPAVHIENALAGSCDIDLPASM
jgi:hypothetical protein